VLRWMPRMRVLIRTSVVVLAAALLMGVIYEQVGRRLDRARYAQIGRSIDIGGRTLNLFCSGQGSPAVILDSGGHTSGYQWIEIQPRIARTTQTCWFDRAGYGWSDPGPSPRTFNATASDLHALMHAAGIAPPYVLVGATASAFHVRLYTSMFPGEVAGAVLIHPSDTDIFAHEPAYMKGAMDNLPHWVLQIECKTLQPVLLDIGVTRLMGNPGAGRPFGMNSLSAPEQRELEFLSNNPETARTEGEGCYLDEEMAEVRAAGNFGDRPLAILTSSRPFKGPLEFDMQTRQLNQFWFHELQPRLAALSTHGKLVVTEDAESPDSIVQNVNQVVAEVRANARTH
jgi:pimeloyl-ACP methyl ester carboxylesterase